LNALSQLSTFVESEYYSQAHLLVNFVDEFWKLCL